MTRFLEEWYASGTYKRLLQTAEVQGADYEGDPYVAPGTTPAVDKERRALRSEYFKAQATKRPTASAAQRRLAWRDPGFG